MEKEIPAKLSGKFYKEETMFPVVGDYVTFRYNPKGDSKIIEICERKNFLTRPDTAKSMKEQQWQQILTMPFLSCCWMTISASIVQCVIKFLGENPGACPWDEAKKYFSKSLMSISSEYNRSNSIKGTFN